MASKWRKYERSETQCEENNVNENNRRNVMAWLISLGVMVAYTESWRKATAICAEMGAGGVDEEESRNNRRNQRNQPAKKTSSAKLSERRNHLKKKSMTSKAQASVNQ
jgi:hypothetical protein